MFVKICGITNREDALAAADAGARALGFIFYPASPRSVTPEQIEPWITGIPGEIWKVGVFVDQTPDEIERMCAQLRLDIAQLHDPLIVGKPLVGPTRVWKAFRVKDAQTTVPDYPAAEAILIDGFEYDWSRTAHLTRPLILAGGLNESNVRDRIQRARTAMFPSRDREGAVTEFAGRLWAVDVASGIESSPGRKDHVRMKKFIEAALCS